MMEAHREHDMVRDERRVARVEVEAESRPFAEAGARAPSDVLLRVVHYLLLARDLGLASRESYVTQLVS